MPLIFMYRVKCNIRRCGFSGAVFFFTYSMYNYYNMLGKCLVPKAVSTHRLQQLYRYLQVAQKVVVESFLMRDRWPTTSICLFLG